MKEMPHWLSKQSEQNPNKIALEDEYGNQWTFWEIEQTSKSYARKLYKAGIRGGDHVGICSHNEPHMIMVIYALSYLGAVAVLLNTKLTKAELTYQIKDAEISMMITNEALSSYIKDLEIVSSCFTFSELTNVAEADVRLNDHIVLSDVFTIMYTSGTTGAPKGVMQTYENHWWSAISSMLNLGLDKHDKWLCSVPMFHISGLSIFLKSIIYGMSVLLFKKFKAETVHQAIFSKQVTMISVVTVMARSLLNELQKSTETSYPDYFRCMLLGGGIVPLSDLEKARAYGVPLYQSYGMTETSSQIVTLSPESINAKIGSAGKPLLPASLRITSVDAAGIGEIEVKGPMVTKGYYNKPAATQAAFCNEWLKTGDMGYLDEDGFVYIVDRRNDLIISGGENIYPAELEKALMNIKGISAAGVCGMSDANWGERPVAFIESNDAHLSASEIKLTLQESLAPYKIPDKIFLVSTLPRNASNKLLRRTLQEWLQKKLENSCFKLEIKEID